MEDDDSRAQGGQRDIQAAARGGRLQLPGKVLQVGLRGVAQEFEKVVAETVSACPINDEIRDGQDFEEQAGSPTLTRP